MTSNEETRHGHILSPKSLDLQRDTFFFITLAQKSELFLGMVASNPRCSSYAHCPMTILSAGIMTYYVKPSGPAFEPSSTELLPPGIMAGECTYNGYPGLIKLRPRLYTFEERWQTEAHYGTNFVADDFRPAEASIVVARDTNRCWFTSSEEDNLLAWIIPPAVSWETDNSALPETWDKTPFFIAANIVAIDRHTEHDAATDHFLMLLGGDINEVYPNSVILSMMDELGVDYIGNEDRDALVVDEQDMAPLDDERWRTELGQVILADVLKSRIAQSLDESGRSGSRSDSPDDVDELAEAEPPSSGSYSPDDTQKSRKLPGSSLGCSTIYNL
ncbi:hypothetical protein B0H17DRAFT_1149140 [Mycena rosella]|uniref:Uncharacterized protein n=1 Tax=Mycena rosella TaxID=1033263 RepID=A0AAD7FS35_MYCRO|nr:hypothetical protein B0H17DRAFT_1149140 [Mycena rosella]